MFVRKACAYGLPYDNLSPVSKGLLDYYDPPKVSSNYNKQWVALLVVQKSAVPSWVKWVHQSEGVTHCQECLMLDGCWFLKEKTPMWPHHPYCHCILDPIDYAVVRMNATAQSDYSKFDPYLFDPDNFYKHGKNIAFESWGYSVSDALWLKNEIEKQSAEKYALGEYRLGVLNQYGQRISIRIEVPRKNGTGTVSFITGWTVLPNGKIKLNTPYGGK